MSYISAGSIMISDTGEIGVVRVVDWEGHIRLYTQETTFWLLPEENEENWQKVNEEDLSAEQLYFAFKIVLRPFLGEYKL